MAATKTNDALRALMAAALALPGMAQAADPDVRSENISLSYNRGQYSENNKRMDIDVDQVSLTAPIGDRYEIKLNALRDVTSGASPFSNRLVNGKPVMILATAASIREERKVVDLSGAYYGDNFKADINVGRSTENDYRANFISGGYRRYLNDKSTTVSVGLAYSDDTVWEKYYPLAQGSAPSVYRDRRKHDIVVGVSQILDADSVAQLSLSHGYAYGYLNDQYRRAMVWNGRFPTFILDSRPDNHTQWSALARYSRYLAPIRSALHLDYRFVRDSWSANSHALEAKLRSDLGGGWTVSPGLRYFTQKNAAFYDLYFTKVPDNKLASNDYRLAAFGAISPKLEVSKSFKNGLAVRLSGENYLRKYKYRAHQGRGDKLDDYKARLLSLSVEGGF